MNDTNLISVLESLQQRLQRLEDKEAITTLLNHYCRVCDTHDFESFGNTFTEDGVLHYEEWGKFTALQKLPKPPASRAISKACSTRSPTSKSRSQGQIPQLQTPR